MLLIKDIVFNDNISINLDDTIDTAIKTMCLNRQGVVVILSDNIPMGIITEKDILHLINTDIDYNAPVSNILNLKTLITVNSKRTVEYALHLFIDNNVRRLIVIDDKNSFVGIITQDILIKHLEDDSFQTNLSIENFIKAPRTIVNVSTKNSIENAFNIMREKNTGSIVIEDENNKVIGIITEKDLIQFINEKGDIKSSIKELITKPATFVNQTDKVKDVVTLMDEKMLQSVLVLDKHSKPKFVLSTRDIALNLKGNYGNLLEIKLKNVKKTLNIIDESILEVVNDNNEQVIQWMNDNAIENFGNNINKAIEEIIKSDIWEDIYAKAKVEGKSEKVKLSIRGLYFEVICSYYFSKDKETILVILRDISEFENALVSANKKSEGLREELNILQGVIDQQNNIVLVSNGIDIISANKKFYDFFQVENLMEFKDRFHSITDTFISHKNFFSHEGEGNWIDKILELPQKDRVVSIVELQTVEPKAFTIQLNKLSSDNSNYVITLTDITDIKLESQKHYFNATHDVLTGIFNRAYFLDAIKDEVERSKRYKTNFSIIMFDVDFFKRFNDTYGHLKGDEVLKRLTKTVNDNIRATDILARWGGEEFIVLLPNTSLQNAEFLAENLRKKIESIDIKGILRVTASFGVAELKEDDDRNSLTKRADEALYLAKNSGRNCVRSK